MSEAAASPKPGVLGLLRGGSLAGSLVLGVAGIATLAAGPLLYRAGVLDLAASTGGIERWAMLEFGAAAAFALIGLVASLLTKRQRGAIVGILAVVATSVGFGTLFSQGELRQHLPPIHDVQTDWRQPVAFSESTLSAREAAGAVRVRDDAMVPADAGEWSGMSFADAQKDYELEPLLVKVPPAEATVAAADAARRLGWDVMLSDPPEGAMEAVHHSFWYGLASDIAVRVVAEGAGSRIDVRSTSRNSGGDMGANAGQVKALLDEIAFALRSE